MNGPAIELCGLPVSTGYVHHDWVYPTTIIVGLLTTWYATLLFLQEIIKHQTAYDIDSDVENGRPC